MQLRTTATFSATDGHATGTYAYVGPTITDPNPGGQITGATWAANSTTINLTAAPPATLAVGDLVAASPTGTPPPGFPPATTPTVVTGLGATSFTISSATTAADAVAATLGYRAVDRYHVH